MTLTCDTGNSLTCQIDACTVDGETVVLYFKGSQPEYTFLAKQTVVILDRCDDNKASFVLSVGETHTRFTVAVEVPGKPV